jgi:hypothetical protein
VTELGSSALHLIQIAWLVSSTAEDPLAENKFLQAGKGAAENTKEKSRQRIMVSGGSGGAHRFS